MLHSSEAFRRAFGVHLVQSKKMRSNNTKQVAITVAERCRNILASNWQARLNTIKADAKGSKEDIYTSKVHYFVKKGKPYLWIPEHDLHNMNAIIDERASLTVGCIVPGPLMSLLRSIRKLPPRVALVGEIVPLKENKVQSVRESLRESILLETKAADQASYTVSAILTSARTSCRLRSEHLQEILDESDNSVVHKFNIRSCTYVDGSGDTLDMEDEDVVLPKADLISPFTEKLIDGINQSLARRRALMLFCLEYHNATAHDALMLSIDRKGFDVLAKVPEASAKQTLPQQYNWKEFRFTFKEEAQDIETFCRLLVELEEETLQSVKSYGGLG